MRTSTLILLCAALLLTACGSNRQTGIASPWRDTNTPDDLALLADDMLAYAAIHSRQLPPTLTHIDASGLASGGPYDKRAIAYHPKGIGIIGEGWRVIAVDDKRREAKHLWCIVRPPVRIGHSASLRVVLVPEAELIAAAERASG